MAFTNAETKLPKLLLDHVHSRRVELEIPVIGTLPFFEQLSEAERTMPCVVFYVSDWTLPHPKLFRCVLLVDLMANTHDNTATDETTWAAAIRKAVTDVPAFKTWLAALNEAQRTSWTLTKFRPLEGGVGTDKETGIRTRRTAIIAHFRADETTP